MGGTRAEHFIDGGGGAREMVGWLVSWLIVWLFGWLWLVDLMVGLMAWSRLVGRSQVVDWFER